MDATEIATLTLALLTTVVPLVSIGVGHLLMGRSPRQLARETWRWLTRQRRVYRVRAEATRIAQARIERMRWEARRDLALARAGIRPAAMGEPPAPTEAVIVGTVQRQPKAAVTVTARGSMVGMPSRAGWALEMAAAAPLN